MIINLLSNPRNISTALMYSFAQRQDMAVVDEPFYAYYLSRNKLRHPGREEILASQPHDKNQILHELKERENPSLFIKNMAHHFESADYNLFLSHRCILNIRHPAEILNSYHKINQDPTIDDIAIKKQFDIMEYLEHNQCQYVILNSRDLLSDSEKILRKLCSSLDIVFDPNMLHWPEGPKEYDGCWAKYWYSNVHNSSGFEVRTKKEVTLPSNLQKVCDEAMPYYNQLDNLSIK